MAVHSYLRVSTSNKGQTVETQRAAIKEDGHAIDYWYEEEISGAKDALDRPEFARMLANMKAGDKLVVTALDRIGRNANDVNNTTELLKNMGISITILNLGSVDITSSFGECFLKIIAALAQLERCQIQERVQQGIDRVKGEGVKLGRHLKITPKMLAELCSKKKEGMTLKALSEKYKLDIMTVQRNIKLWGEKMEEYTEMYNKQQAYTKAKIMKEKK